MTVQLAPSVFYRKIRGLQTVYSFETRRYFYCNEVASVVLEGLAKNLSSEKIATNMTSEYAVTFAKAHRDVLKTIEIFHKNKLVRKARKSLGRVQKNKSVGIGVSSELFEKQLQLELKKYLAKKNFVKIPRFFNKQAEEWVRSQVRSAKYIQKSHDAVSAVEDSMRVSALHDVLFLIFNSDEMIESIRIITGNSRIKGFVGRGYRLRANPQHFFDWHSDMAEGRRLAVSINIKSSRYEGGDLEIRECRRPAQLQRVKNHRFNSAVLFNVRKNLEHRVVSVQSGQKHAFVGWFTTKSDLNAKFW